MFFEVIMQAIKIAFFLAIVDPINIYIIYQIAKKGNFVSK